MRLSAYPIQNLKEVPADAEVVSHQLMLRAGLIRRVASGLYTWLPMGLRVLRKVERVIREEMDRAGAFELSMPVAQPAELWVESGRWDKFGPELLRFKDRHDRDMVLGPTHEEIITEIDTGDFDMELTGFEPAELKRLFSPLPKATTPSGLTKNECPSCGYRW